MIMAMHIVNDQTAEIIIPKGLKIVDEDLDEVQEWPGIDLDVANPAHEQAVQALIGSPNGLGVAYFLLQYKQQLGGAKSIVKIKVWRSEDEDQEEPNIIFYVGDAPPLSQGDTTVLREAKQIRERGGIDSRVVTRREHGSLVVREHIVHAKL